MAMDASAEMARNLTRMSPRRDARKLNCHDHILRMNAMLLTNHFISNRPRCADIAKIQTSLSRSGNLACNTCIVAVTTKREVRVFRAFEGTE